MKASLATLIGRGLRKRCPRCGSKGIFESWFKLKAACPTCGYLFEREEGYWVGAIVINTAVTEVLFGIMFIGTLILQVPDVQWRPLIAITVATNGIFPWFFYPYSKTLWMAVDLHFHPAAGMAQGRSTTT